MKNIPKRSHISRSNHPAEKNNFLIEQSVVSSLTKNIINNLLKFKREEKL
jgi:hypothetical protein